MLYLTGFMGTGKSAVGPRLAKALGYTYLDLDQVIEQQANMSIPEIFDAQGETAFRTLESAALQQVSRASQQVVSTGGGVVISESNRTLMAQSGHVVCLTASPTAIVHRTRRGGRPLLEGNPNPLARVRQLLEEREPFYRTCHHIVDTTGRSVDSVAREIAKLHREGEWQR